MIYRRPTSMADTRLSPLHPDAVRYSYAPGGAGDREGTMTDEEIGPAVAEPEHWTDGGAYERYLGRWSRLVAREFLPWLEAPPGGRWLDLGCGSGALTQAILEHAAPIEVTGVDTSDAMLAYAESHVLDFRAHFLRGSMQELPFEDAHFDAVVSGLVLNFATDPKRAMTEMTRIARPDAIVGGYVWDYAAGMEMLRSFWDAAAMLDPAALELDEAGRYPYCRPDALRSLFVGAGLKRVAVSPIEIPMAFRSFEKLWEPFTTGQGPAPAYVAALPASRRNRLRELVRRGLTIESDGSIHLTARAWAIKGTRP